MKKTSCFAVAVMLFAVSAPGCGKKKEKEKPAGAGQQTNQAKASLVGVDEAKKIVYIGALNDESGPAAIIGKPFANGKRLMAARINAGGSGLLPEGWKVELVEKDHAYNPQKSVQHYNAIKDKVLFITTSFGTPNTLPLRKHLKRDNLMAFPASLSSQMAEHEYTPPVGASYNVEAQRAMDWAIKQAGGADKVKAGVVYQEDDYGKDGLKGWREAAKRHGVSVVSEKTVTPGQKEVTAVVSALKDAGATHVLLSVLPSSSGPILGTAAQNGFTPIWIGNTPAWIDRFFSPEVIPPAALANFYVASGIVFWGEERPGMDEFIKTWETHGKGMGDPNWYIFMSYAAGLIQMEVVRRTIESGDLTREGFRKALHSLKKADAGGLLEPLDFSKVPYEVSTEARVLGLDLPNKTFKVLGDFAEAMKSPAAAAPAPAAAPAEAGK